MERFVFQVELSWYTHAPDSTNLIVSRRLFIPIEETSESSGHPEQHIYIIDKDENGNVTTKKEYGVRYVPLTDAPAERP
jgi:protein-L-isoaspartate(D-aspartate) O-methyltransferase